MDTISSNPDHITNIKAEIESVTFHAEDSGWTVLKARNCSNNSTFTATGNFATVYPGESFELYGTWRKHPSFGNQFNISQATALKPTTRPAIVRYLSSGIFKGIGDKTAQKIVDTFGTQTLNIFEQQINRLCEVPTLGDKKVKLIIESWNEHRATAEIMMFLSQHGISNTLSHRIIKMYGTKTVEIVSSDPYRLAIDVRGIGFNKADEIAQSMGIASDSPQRIKAAILFQLQQAEENGHCFLDHYGLVTQLQSTLKLELSIFKDVLPQCVEELEQTNIIISENYVDTNEQPARAFYRSELFLAEIGVVGNIKKLLKTKESGQFVDAKDFENRVNTWVEKYSEGSSISLSTKQKLAVLEAARHKVFILTGGPGVGKTTTANTIIRLLKAMGKSIVLAAPTGRAAQRLNEVSSFEAKTIHRLIEWTPGEKIFGRNEENPLAADVVIVDESSMLDIKLADNLFRAVRDSAKLILIGDVDQLPSVGPGNVLKDLIDSNIVPCIKLDEIFRQAKTSKIINVAHEINKGIAPEFSNEADSDCHFIQIHGKDPEKIKEKINQLIQYDLPTAGYHPTQDVQILTPMNRGPLGTHILNEDLQDILNPSSEKNTETKKQNIVLRKGDKVIQVANNYDLSVFNGDIGYIEHTNVDGAKLIVNYSGKLVHYDSEQAGDLRLAYAITIHKSQGSEFPVVIIPMSHQHHIMLQQNLIYTGLTRAKKLAIFVGSHSALSYACKNQVSSLRLTQLKNKLIKELSK